MLIIIRVTYLDSGLCCGVLVTARLGSVRNLLLRIVKGS